MATNENPQKTIIDNWTFRISAPKNPHWDSPILLLLHGHLGDENAMWILTKQLPDTYYMLAPRAPVQIADGQFSWHKIDPQWPTLDDYRQLTEGLINRVDTWVKENFLNNERYHVMGFSQGAVMAYALAALHPARIGKVAALAGFIPQNWQTEISEIKFDHRQFFVAHGKKDEIIPIEKAKKAANWLTHHGAQVTFCEADIGHKFSSNCFTGLGEFFE